MKWVLRSLLVRLRCLASRLPLDWHAKPTHQILHKVATSLSLIVSLVLRLWQNQRWAWAGTHCYPRLRISCAAITKSRAEWMTAIGNCYFHCSTSLRHIHKMEEKTKTNCSPCKRHISKPSRNRHACWNSLSQCTYARRTNTRTPSVCECVCCVVWCAQIANVHVCEHQAQYQISSADSFTWTRLLVCAPNVY